MTPLLLKAPIAIAVAVAILGLAACASEPPQIVQAPTAYCYVSLANVECYRAPVPGQAYRLVGTRPTPY